MKMFRTLLVLSLAACCAGPLYSQKDFTLESPDGRVKAEIKVGKSVEYSVRHDGDLMLSPSKISLTLGDGSALGVNGRVAGTSTRRISQPITAQIYKKNIIRDSFNELTVKFREGYNIVFRAYDDGIAYRFVTNRTKPLTVVSEQAQFNFPADSKAWIPYVRNPRGSLTEQMFTSFENTYEYINLSAWDESRLAFLPLLVEGVNGKKVCITEADLLNYPGMFLHNSPGSTTLNGVFAPVPRDIEQGGHNMLQGVVRTREEYIAYFDGPAHFPWRVIIVTARDTQLADNDMVYRLATAPQGDYSWVKPGKVAWDWWNAWNLYGVDFKAGINNETYKYYIDFASRHGIEYVILDEGWAVNKKADLMQVVPEIDLPMLARYAESKNVGLILWAGYLAFERDMENVCRHYSAMGIKGFKVDFMDRDDQPMVDFHRRAAEMGAKYKLLMDFHGTYKPTGLHRTYPNVINFEGVYGLEQMKWAKEVDMVAYDVTFPFIRQVAGPVDYTQGAMRNATKGNYRSVYNEAMSQGTRCRQLAEYVVFESPVNMLCDSPSNYMAETECLEFIAGIPTVWDETVAIDGKVGEYIAIARRSGNVWYVGVMTDWNAREMELDLSFLGAGVFEAEVFRDGINAGKAARDYRKETVPVTGGKMKVGMAGGGGFVARITGR